MGVSRIGGRNFGSFGSEIDNVFSRVSRGALGFWMVGFSSHSSGCLRGLNVKNPAEKMCVPCFLDLRRIEDAVAVEATAQYGSLLFISFTEHPSIFLTCLLTGKGKCILNSPCSLVFDTSRKLGLASLPPHSTATDAPGYHIA